MFSYNEHSGQSNLEKVSIHDLFEDVKLTAGGAELSEKGYIPLATENTWLKLQYMAKPTQAVVDYMVKSGRGEPGKAEIGITNTISFSSYWDASYGKFETTPRIAGVVEESELENFKKSAELVGDCIVNKAYKEFHRLHPNYALRAIREPVGSELRNIQRHAQLVWVAVGYALKNDKIIKRAENGEFDNFYLDQKLLNVLKNKFDVDVRVVHKDKRIASGASLEMSA